MFKIFIIFFCICFPLKADQYDLRLKNLFNQLQETEIETEIESITINIWDIWHETNDPKISSDFFKGIGLMHNGNLEEQGSHQELMDKKGRYYALYRQQDSN